MAHHRRAKTPATTSSWPRRALVALVMTVLTLGIIASTTAMTFQVTPVAMLSDSPAPPTGIESTEAPTPTEPAPPTDVAPVPETPDTVAPDAEAAPPPTSGTAVLSDEQLARGIFTMRISWQAIAQEIDPDGYPTPTLWTAELESQCSAWAASNNGDIMTNGHCVDPLEVKRQLQSMLAPEAFDYGFDPKGGPPTDMPMSPDFMQQAPVLSDEQIFRTVQLVQPATIQNRLLDTWTTARYVAHQSFNDGDLALVKLEGYDGQTVAIPVATTAPQLLEPVTAVGYQGTLTQIASLPTDVLEQPDLDGLADTRLNPSLKDGTISSQQFTPGGASVWEISAPMSPGMSGGPTLNARGEVIGTNSFTIDLQPFNFITDYSNLQNFLRDHGVTEPAAADASPSTEPGSTEDGTNVTPSGNQSDLDSENWKIAFWVVFAAALLLAALLAMAVLRVGLFSHRQETATRQSNTTDTPEEPVASDRT